MALKFQTSEKFSLDWRDAGKGLIVAVLTAVFTAIHNGAIDDDLNFNWKIVVAAGISGGVAYLLKNFFSPSQIVIKKDTTQPE